MTGEILEPLLVGFFVYLAAGVAALQFFNLLFGPLFRRTDLAAKKPLQDEDQRNDQGEPGGNFHHLLFKHGLILGNWEPGHYKVTASTWVWMRCNCFPGAASLAAVGSCGAMGGDELCFLKVQLEQRHCILVSAMLAADLCTDRGTMDNKPELKVSVFSDYICPFCYIGFLRLEKLRREFDLKVNWALIEIHPDTPAAGQDLKELGYSSEQWHQMMDGLAVMAGEEGIVLAEQTRISNSRSALMLAEAAKEAGKEIFYSLHRGLFEAYFLRGRDIGDQAVLEVLAREAGLDEKVFQMAFADPVYAERLNRNMMLARDAGVTGTPTYFFGQRKITGAVETELLLATARQLTRE